MVETHSKTFATVLAFPPVAIRIFERQPGRISLDVSIDGSDSCLISFGGGGNGQAVGVVNNPNNPLHLTADDAPGMIEEEVWVKHNGSGCNLFAVEVWCIPCEAV